jgi:uncharacterized RDD family membrane protein YckC/Tfp pilus assembly major pilin PilA
VARSSLDKTRSVGKAVQEAMWYFMDRHGQRQGPVAAVDVKAAYRSGDLLREGLVWRQGMTQWLPLAQVEREFGIDPIDQAAAPLPLPAASPDETAIPGSRSIDRSDIVHAGFMRRWAALFLDNFILLVPLLLIFFVLGMMLAVSGTHQPGQDPPPAVLLVYPLWFLVRMLYFALMESSAHQGTIGKRALGIKVTDDNGQRLSFPHALGRWFAAALSYPLYIGFLMAGFTERKRALHDMVASTLVVDRWAYTEFPERQQRSASGCLIAFLVFAIGCVPAVAILAAIAIPQYQDYVIRSQVAEGAVLSEGAQTAVADFYRKQGHYPTTNAAAGLASASSIRGQYISSIKVGPDDGTITVTYSSSRPQKANTAIHMKTLLLAPKALPGRFEWRCTSPDLKQKWCPYSCQCSG